MPTFFFDIDDGHGLEHDDSGTDLPNEQIAKQEALALLPCIAGNQRGAREGIFVCEVRNKAGRRIVTARLTLTAL